MTETSMMASPEQPASSRPRRPAAMTRQSSSQSHISQSPSEKGPHHRPQQHKVAHRHVAGGRMQRTLSAGKNLGKFAKGSTQHAPAQAVEDGGGGGGGGRHHRRSQSGTSISAPSSPRPGFKRNASSGAIMRHNPAAHAHVGLRKNHSSGHLVGKAKGGKSSKDLAGVKGKLGHHHHQHHHSTSRSRPASPEERPVVHFDMGDGDEDDNDDNNDDDDEEEGGWTEESASQSPNTTRSNTRSSSVATEAQRAVDDATESNTRANARDDTSPPPPPPVVTSPVTAQTQAHHTQTPAPTTTTLPDRRTTSSTHSRPPDADLITSRLLQRSASHTVVAPQPSAVSAIVQPTTASSRGGPQLSTSVGSTLVDTPGRDLVSRFMDGDGSAGTPHDGTYMSARRPVSKHDADLAHSKRNRSTPNLDATTTTTTDDRDRDPDTPTRPQSVKSGATTPNLFPPVTNRTQNKLLLQRAASAIEPHAPVPAILRAAGPSFHNLPLTYPGEGRLDPRLQQQFNHVAIEYQVVLRYRDPLADSIGRVQQMPGMLRRLRGGKVGKPPGSAGGSGNENLAEVEGGRRRSRAGSEAGEVEDGREGEIVGGGGGGGVQGERPRNEAQELCRRMWDSAEIVGGE